ncbi:MAG: FAD binding domain-containing protein [Bacillus sp. (in: firmicutes)]
MTYTIETSKIIKPSTIQEAVMKKAEWGKEACFIAGGTFLQLEWEKGKGIPNYLIDVSSIHELEELTIKNAVHYDVLSIGALTTLATCRHHVLIKQTRKLLSDALKNIAAPSVRNRGTIGGNIACRFGDVIPALLAMDAEIGVYTPTGYKKKSLWTWIRQENNELDFLITNIEIPLFESSNHQHCFYKKIGRREAFTAAIVTVSGCVSINDRGVITQIRLAIGGGDNAPQRLTWTEKLLLGTQLNIVDWKSVYRSIQQEFVPATDVFITGHYRKKVAANLLISHLQMIEHS